MPIYEPGLPRSIARSAGRLHSPPAGPGAEHTRLLFRGRGGRRQPTPGRRPVVGANRGGDAMPSFDRHALVHEVERCRWDGRSIRRALDQRGSRFSYVSCPEFLKEARLEDFLAPEPRSGGRTVGAGPATRSST